MTQISFHVNVPDALPYACRLLRKAYRAGARVVVTGSERDLQQLDKLLWTFEPLEFVPHMMVSSLSRDAAEGPDMAASSASDPNPIWFMASLPEQLPAGATVLLSLSEEPIQSLGRFERLIDIVSASDAHRESGRRRWKHYVAAGHRPEKHEVIA